MDPISLLLVGAIGGAVVGGISQIFEDSSVRRQSKLANDYIDKDLANQTDILAKEFALQKQQAKYKAGLQDKETTQGEKALSSNINSQLAQISLSGLQFGEELSAQDIASGLSYGANLVNLSQSGIRNSSISQAVDMQAAISSSQIAATSSQYQKSQNISLKSILNDFSNGMFNVQNSRDNANYLRNSYETGGDAYKAYQLELESLNDSANLAKQKNNDSLAEYNRFDNTFNRFMTSMFGGANSGLSLAYSIGTYTGKKDGFNSANYEKPSFNHLTSSNPYTYK